MQPSRRVAALVALLGATSSVGASPAFRIATKRTYAVVGAQAALRDSPEGKRAKQSLIERGSASSAERSQQESAATAAVWKIVSARLSEAPIESEDLTSALVDLHDARSP